MSDEPDLPPRSPLQVVREMSARHDLLMGFSASARIEGDPDLALLSRIATGEQEAIEELYRRHSRLLLGQIRFMVGQPALAEEILQDTMLAVWRGARSFRGGSRVRTWLLAIARRQARDRMRRQRLLPLADAELAQRPSPNPGPEAVAVERAEARRMVGALGTLTPAHREVLGLVFGADLSLAEVARVLAVPPGTVKSRLHAARAALGRTMNAKE
jgi:RNA polymerase sigma-70 factor (ECF subfamily)